MLAHALRSHDAVWQVGAADTTASPHLMPVTAHDQCDHLLLLRQGGRTGLICSSIIGLTISSTILPMALL